MIEATHFSLDALCALSGTPKRTARYYVQIGLLDRPEGGTKGAHYLGRHLEQLLQIRRMSEAGLSLERIREVLAGEPEPLPAKQRKPGSIEVRSHLYIAPGIELGISPEEAGLSPQQLRSLAQRVLEAFQAAKGDPS